MIIDYGFKDGRQLIYALRDSSTLSRPKGIPYHKDRLKYEYTIPIIVGKHTLPRPHLVELHKHVREINSRIGENLLSLTLPTIFKNRNLAWYLIFMWEWGQSERIFLSCFPLFKEVQLTGYVYDAIPEDNSVFTRLPVPPIGASSGFKSLFNVHPILSRIHHLTVNGLYFQTTNRKTVTLLGNL